MASGKFQSDITSIVQSRGFETLTRFYNESSYRLKNQAQTMYGQIMACWKRQIWKAYNTNS